MRKTLTHEEFVKRVKQNNKHDITILGTYINLRTKILVRCNIHNIECYICPSTLLKGGGCRMCRGDAIAASKIKSNQEFLDRLNALNKGFTALEEYRGLNTKIQFECLKKHIWKTTPKSLFHGSDCPYCAGKIPIIGETSLWDTHPNVASLLKDPNDGYKYSKGTHKKVSFICKDCGHENIKSICDVCAYGFSCNFCSDYVSYPNKFGRAFLDQLPIENFICEYSPEWAGCYSYDNYFVYNNVEYILEMDGKQHYYENGYFKRSLYETQKVDMIKDYLAEENGINVIRVECIKSECDYIKNNILNSELNNIFDLSNIDWLLCDKISQSNMIKMACDLYMSGIHSFSKIGSEIHVSTHTVEKYLRRGLKFGWCNSIQNADSMRRGYCRMIPIILVDDCNNVLCEFKSITECVEYMKNKYNMIIYKNAITKSCQTHIPYKGFKFEYKNTIQND